MSSGIDPSLLILIIFTASCSAKNNENLGLIIDEPYINLPLKGQMMSVGYFKLANHSNESIVLNKIFCKDFDASLHTSFLNSEGMMAMKSVENIQIESGSSIIFQPGSHHIMIVGLDAFMKDDKLECSLVIDKTQNLPIVFKLQ